jgi:cobalt/nickel transport system permease protein
VAWSHSIWGWQLTISHAGLTVFWSVLAKAWLSILVLILLTSTTSMTLLLLAMEKLKVPQPLITTISFMYRYVFILEDEVMRMRQARDSRNLGSRRLWQIKVVGHMIGTLFIRAYERGERTFAAMLSRGFDGRMHTLHRPTLKRADIQFATIVIASVISVRMLDFGLGLMR